jgi:hypothetical protein
MSAGRQETVAVRIGHNIPVSTDWTALRTAEGDATAVPALLAELRSVDRSIAQRAEHILEDLLIPDAELVDACLPVAVEVTQALTQGRFPHPEWVLWLLGSMLSSESEPTLQAAVHRTIEDHLPSYVEYLRNPVPSVRHAAISLLGSFEERGAEAKPILEHMLADGAAGEDRERLLQAIGWLDGADAPWPDWHGSIDINHPGVAKIIRRREAAIAALKSGATVRKQRPGIRSRMVRMVMRLLGHQA